MTYENFLKPFEKFLNELDFTDDSDVKVLDQAMKYSLFSGGKRIRPLLFLITFSHLSEKDISEAWPYAAAVEMIHTYSLIHDDLPCMDDDDLRRNKPTNHKVYGEAIATLAGDCLLNYAQELMLKSALSSENIDLKQSVKAIKYILNHSGSSGMIGGQILDICYDHRNSDANYVEKTYCMKTASLIKASVVGAAVLAGADSKTVNALEKYSENIGITYQLKDDLLDDGNDDFLNILSLMTKEEVEKIIFKKTEEALKELDDAGFSESPLKNLTLALTNREL